MDATLAESALHGPLAVEAARKEVDARARPARGGRRRRRVLWHNDRFDRVYGRGWDGVYEHLLDGIVARGGTAGTARRAVRLVEGRALRVLIVSFYFPPAGGGGVQRVLKLCRHLADLGIEVDVLAPDDPRFSAQDPELLSAIPASTTVHRAPYRGPSGETPASRLARTEGTGARLALHARLTGRRLLLPDPEVAWVPDAVRVGTRVIRERGIDCVLTTSPPSSAHLIGAALKRRTGVRFVADVRDSLAREPPSPLRAALGARQARRRGAHRPPVLGRADAITAVTPFIAREAPRSPAPATPVHVVPNGSDFDDFDGLTYTPGERLVVLHAGSFFGQRSPRPFLEALAALDDPRDRRPASSATCARPIARGRSTSAWAIGSRSTASGPTARRSRR